MFYIYILIAIMHLLFLSNCLDLLLFVKEILGLTLYCNFDTLANSTRQNCIDKNNELFAS